MGMQNIIFTWYSECIIPELLIFQMGSSYALSNNEGQIRIHLHSIDEMLQYTLSVSPKYTALNNIDLLETIPVLSRYNTVQYFLILWKEN